MADVQTENGYTKIANEILDQTSRLHLNGTQYSILLTIWRFTYGFHRCEHDLSISFIAMAIDSTVRVVRRELKNLIDYNVITVSKESTKSDSRVLKFNKDYDTWEQGSKRSSGVQSDLSQGSNQTSQQGSNQTSKKLYKDNLKKEPVIIINSDENAFISILESVENYPSDRQKDLAMYKALKATFPRINTIDAINDWSIYKTDHPLKKDCSPRSQINNSFKNCVKWGKCLKQTVNTGRAKVLEGEGAGERRADG